MRNEFLVLTQQLAGLAAACRDYEEMQEEILSLLGSYLQGGAYWGKDKSTLHSGQLLSILSPTDDILHLYREGQPFSKDEQALGELCLPVLILLSRLQREKDLEEQQRQAQLVKSVMNTLSYTELEVVIKIFRTLDKTEGVLIAGKIADSLGITRSVVVSALRKLESARIIETRSLGVKGTYINILNPLWTKELSKLKV